MQIFTSFELLREQALTEFNTTARFYRHAKTGAELLSLVNDDENKVFGVTFRTPPRNSTGVAISRARRALRLAQVSGEGTIRRAHEGLAEHFPQCDDLSGQDLLSGRKSEISGTFTT